jgi:hypothetical protein
MGIIFALLGALVIGIANVLVKKSFSSFSPSASFFIFRTSDTKQAARPDALGFSPGSGSLGIFAELL